MMTTVSETYFVQAWRFSFSFVWARFRLEFGDEPFEVLQFVFEIVHRSAANDNKSIPTRKIKTS